MRQQKNSLHKKELFHRRFISSRNLSKENCLFCINYVVECAIKLQETEFDINELSR